MLQTEGTNPQTEGFVRGFAGRDALMLAQVLAPMEKWKRDQLIPVLEQWLALLENALASRSGLPAVSEMERELSAQRSSQELMSALRFVQKALEYARGNVSPAAVCGWLQWKLR